MPPTTNPSSNKPSKQGPSTRHGNMNMDNAMNQNSNRNANKHNNKNKNKGGSRNNKNKNNNNNNKKKGLGVGMESIMNMNMNGNGRAHQRNASSSILDTDITDINAETKTDMVNYVHVRDNTGDPSVNYSTFQVSTVGINTSPIVAVDDDATIDVNAPSSNKKPIVITSTRKVLPFIVDSANWSGYKKVSRSGFRSRPRPKPGPGFGPGPAGGVSKRVNDVGHRSGKLSGSSRLPFLPGHRSGKFLGSTGTEKTRQTGLNDASAVEETIADEMTGVQVHAAGGFDEEKTQEEPGEFVEKSASKITDNSIGETFTMSTSESEPTKVYWPNSVAENNSRSYSFPRRKDPADVANIKVGKEKSCQEATEQDTTPTDDNEEPLTPSNTAVSSPGRGFPVPMVRARSFEDVFSDRHDLVWKGDSEHIDHPPNDGSVDPQEESTVVTGASEPQSLSQNSASIQKPKVTSPESSTLVVTDVPDAVDFGDGQSDTGSTDSDKTATQTSTAGNRQNVTEEDEEFENRSDPLREYLLGILEIGQFTDSQIVLKSFNRVFPPIAFRTHKAIIARSPIISCILNTQDCQGADVEINVTAGESFTMVKAFEVALQNLYGLPVLNQERLRRETLSAVGHTEKSARMNPAFIKKAGLDFVVCYTTSGAFFGNYEVVETGANLAVELIDWDTVELAIHFGLAVDNFLVAYFDHIPVREQVGEAQAQINVAAIKDLREVWGPKFIMAAFEFIVNNISNNNNSNMDSKFILYTKAQTTIMPDRIPYCLRFTPGSILANPKLATVKFGSFPTHERPTREKCITSAALLSLLFEQLKELFNLLELKQILTENLAREVIQEREMRRVRALEAYARQKAQDSSPVISNDKSKSTIHSISTSNNKQQGKQQQQQEPLLDPSVNELGYREFVSSKGTLLGTRVPAVSVQIVLEREWTGLE